MAFRAKDGRAFGRRDQMRAYDERTNNKDKDASDERSGHETREHGGSLESKPDQPPAEVDHQRLRGENPARNPNPGPREPGSRPDPGITSEDTRDQPDSDSPIEGGGAGDSLENISDFTAAHGPAEHIEIRHSGGLSHVTTTHKGGARHVSTHPTPQSAHMHAADAAGINQAIAEEAASPEMEDQIPGMRRAY